MSILAKDKRKTASSPKLGRRLASEANHAIHSLSGAKGELTSSDREVWEADLLRPASLQGRSLGIGSNVLTESEYQPGRIAYVVLPVCIVVDSYCGQAWDVEW